MDIYRDYFISRYPLRGCGNFFPRVVGDETRSVVSACSSDRISVRIGVRRVKIAGRLVGEEYLRRLISALAIATRCICPPESSLGKWLSLSAIESRSTSSANHRSSSLASLNNDEMTIFSLAVITGIRLNCWKIKPIFSQRSFALSRSLKRPMSSPSISTFPLVGESKPASKCSRVDLPQPEVPVIETNSPCSIEERRPLRRISFLPL